MRAVVISAVGLGSCVSTIVTSVIVSVVKDRRRTA